MAEEDQWVTTRTKGNMEVKVTMVLGVKVRLDILKVRVTVRTWVSNSTDSTLDSKGLAIIVHLETWVKDLCKVQCKVEEGRCRGHKVSRVKWVVKVK